MKADFEFRLLTRICRHCGQTFDTLYPAQKTCKRPGCVMWSKDLRRRQNYEATVRWRAKKTSCNNSQGDKDAE